MPAISVKEMYQRFKLHVEERDSEERRIFFSEESDLSALEFIKYQSQCKLVPIRVEPGKLAAIHEGVSEAVKTTNPDKKLQEKGQKTDVPSVSDNRIIIEINSILAEAIESQCSDVHLEPGEKQLKLRTRVDGVLIQKKQIPLSDHPELISRIKIMSGLDIAEKRRPQDGRIRFNCEGRLVDIRVSVIPTDFGEKAVLRILDKEQLRLDLNSLGLTTDQLEIFKKNITATSGIILVTGPTGSGKTTTLYAALNILKSGDVNISTVEDPIEYNLEGINQTQVKPEINLTFAAMLRALLRQDPNIIMVGEIRDKETLEIAIRASQTGHLVLSTVHTNSAVSTITRLLDLGTEPFLLSSSLKMIVAQRLVRKICQSCKESNSNENEQKAAEQIGIAIQSSLAFGRGCSSCNNSGFRGRMAIYEILPIDENLREIIHNRGSEKELLKHARTNSFRTMKERAVELVLEGLTTPSEVIRELGM